MKLGTFSTNLTRLHHSYFPFPEKINSSKYSLNLTPIMCSMQSLYLSQTPRKILVQDLVWEAPSLKTYLKWFRQSGSLYFLSQFHKLFINWHRLFLKLAQEIKRLILLKQIAAKSAKSLQSCPTLCDPIDNSPPGSPVPGILQARTLEWIAISFSNAWKWKVKVKSLSRVQLLATPWTASYQAPLSKGFSRQEYWSGLPLPSSA